LSGELTPDEDKEVIAEEMFCWARELGAVDVAHCVFPIRGGGSAVGGAIGAYKMETMIDLNFD